MRTINLPDPRDLDMSLTQALKTRRTCRELKNEPICDKMLAALLWSCAGITADDGRRTVPSTLDLRAVNAYILREDGTWLYDATNHALVQTCDKDVRELSTAYQFDLVKTAPVTLVFVSDNERAKDARAGATLIDAGTMGQCAYLAATAMGLAGVIRASFDHDALRNGMKLEKHLEPVLLFTVGHPL